MDASPPLAIPRLRLPRYSPQSQALSPIAGPSHSHNPDYLHPDEDDEDAESTPRMSTSAIPDKSSPRSPATPGLPSEPTARLRALLARVPNSPNGTTPHARPALTLPSSSEPESDFEPPHSTITTSSFARESLKELFSHALREPGNTPRKNGRPRRNSIDASEVEASPRVEEERAKYRGKRRTLSDDEVEKSGYTDSSEMSHRSSAASTFAALKQRLDQSTSAMPSMSQAQMVMDMSMPPLNSSTDTAMPPTMKVDTSSDTPPRATSTPMRTFQMSTHLGMHSSEHTPATPQL
ncbi:hypothetical protein L226DRAFT_457869 [Lentinus tigrinus ALCF2SS1-7]|uniref:uncharacterized protein n=1 Tax=Lentinus tigrinus ALCF2SS1-7 TaxID=1328758 RepID=UPI0011663814|nr:hypothetical protein L226DRAFT_457869 [Lentinus tigrinus ALCF2SS1-7]